MPRYNDPQEVHGGTCQGPCGDWFPDNEEDLNANDICAACVEILAIEEAEDCDGQD